MGAEYSLCRIFFWGKMPVRNYSPTPTLYIPFPPTKLQPSHKVILPLMTTVIGKTECEALPGAGIGGTPRDISGACEQKDNCLALTAHKYFYPMAWDKQGRAFPPEDSKQCIHSEVPPTPRHK